MSIENDGAGQVNIIISGIGGQGNVRSAQILGAAAVKAGLRARISDVFGIAQRGGPVLSHVRIGSEIYGSMVSSHGADVVVGLEPMEALRGVAQFLRPGGTASQRAPSLQSRSTSARRCADMGRVAAELLGGIEDHHP